MDTLSQIVLGTTVSLLVTRGRHPKKAIIYGAALGTLPDLDVLMPSANDLAATIEHRTWSHSWVVASLASPLIALGIRWKEKCFSYLRWLALVWLTLITHSALDAFTIYGTDIFWPISSQTIMGASVFIIDPLFTLPLLIATTLAMGREKTAAAVFQQTTLAVILSTSYLIWGLYAQNRVQTIATQSLQTQSLVHQQLIATPTPFNSILWRVLAMGKNQYHEGYYSLLDKNPVIKFQTHNRNREIIELLEPEANWQQFNHFAHGYTKAEKEGRNLIAVDLRMGADNLFFFRFLFGTTGNEEQNHGMTPTTPSRLAMNLEDFGLLKHVWHRIWSEDDIP